MAEWSASHPGERASCAHYYRLDGPQDRSGHRKKRLPASAGNGTQVV